MLVEGDVVIPGVTWYPPQMRSQLGCDGTLILYNRLWHSLNLTAPQAQCDRGAVAQIFPPSCMGKNIDLIPFLRVADWGCIGLSAFSASESDQQDVFAD